ncbi:hypothetical protein [Nocardia arthritidis]|uniref:Uncharacterized protein n=1 Tax=Nocardia arthritidis TaxID=228602 RepID=A0A6G9Y858_9NOCA|nr:hypothetical protein [Nocardia arthritidis]QIS09391.1 hypothetical protein F5544_07425 [Nocardia arthritidis]
MTTKPDRSHGHDVTDAIGMIGVHLMVLLIKLVAVLVVWVVLFPMVSVPVAAAVVVGVLVGWGAGVAVGGVWVAGMVLWRVRSPQTFERFLTARARSRFLRWWRYTRRWDKLMDACGLAITRDDITRTPVLTVARIGDVVDRLRVRMLAGQCPDDYDNRTDRLAHAFGALECRASIVGPGTVELVMRHGDSLAETIALPEIGGGRWIKDAA